MLKNFLHTAHLKQCCKIVEASDSYLVLSLDTIIQADWVPTLKDAPSITTTTSVVVLTTGKNGRLYEHNLLILSIVCMGCSAPLRFRAP